MIACGNVVLRYKTTGGTKAPPYSQTITFSKFFCYNVVGAIIDRPRRKRFQFIPHQCEHEAPIT